MFNMREFLMDCLRRALTEQPDSWTMDRAKAWYSEGWLTDEDMEKINTAIQAKAVPEEGEAVM